MTDGTNGLPPPLPGAAPGGRSINPTSSTTLALIGVA